MIFFLLGAIVAMLTVTFGRWLQKKPTTIEGRAHVADAAYDKKRRTTIKALSAAVNAKKRWNIAVLDEEEARQMWSKLNAMVKNKGVENLEEEAEEIARLNEPREPKDTGSAYRTGEQ